MKALNNLIYFVFKQVRFLLIAIIIFISIGCSNTKNMKNEKPLLAKDLGNNTNEVTLGATGYVLKVPDGYVVVEAKGKEGQHGFHILPASSTSTVFGFIEIEHGYPIVDTTGAKDSLLGYIKSELLNLSVKWELYLSKSKYYYAETPVVSGVSASVFSERKDDIETLISIIETLAKR